MRIGIIIFGIFLLVIISGCLGNNEVRTKATCEQMLEAGQSVFGSMIVENGIQAACRKHCDDNFGSAYKDWKCSDGYVTCICK